MPDPRIQSLKTRAGQLAARAKRERETAPYAERGGLREIAEAKELGRQSRNLHAEAARAEKSRKREIRLIQVAKRQIKIPDDSYRALCRRISDGVDSCADMTAGQRRALIEEFKRLGFQARSSRQTGRKPHNLKTGDPLAEIEAQLSAMGLSWRYAEGILRNLRGLPQEVACPVAGAGVAEQHHLIAALHAEQEKRQLIAAIDRWLADHDRTRANLEQEQDLRRGWHRHRPTLKGLHEHLYGEPFRLDFAEPAP